MSSSLWARFEPKRTAFLLMAFLLLLAAGTVVTWGTAWTVSPARTQAGTYALVEFWDGSHVPSGPLQRPIGIAVAPDGDVYVTDARLRVVRFSAAGAFKSEWGGEGVGPGEFSNPVGIAVGPDGAVFVSDYFQDRLQKFSSDGAFLLAFGSSGSAPGEFNAPAGLAVDAQGSVYVSDFYNHRIQRFSPDGSLEGVTGFPGRIRAGGLHYPTGVSVAPDSRVLVADAYNYQLQWFDGTGEPIARLGYHLFWLWPRPASSTAGFNAPTGSAIGPSGTIHVVDSGNHRVAMLSERGQYLGEWTIPDVNPEIYSPEQAAVSPDGSTLYVTDLASDRVVVLAVRRAPEDRAN